MVSASPLHFLYLSRIYRTANIDGFVVGSNLGLAVVASALKQLYLPNKLQQVVGQEPCLFQGSEVASLGEVGLDVPEPGAQALSH